MKKKRAAEEPELNIREAGEANDPPLKPGLHEQLWQIVIKLPTDYAPWGQMEREFGDCSCGCLWFQELAGEIGYDWGACTNPASARAGLLTFEHQGCPHFEEDTGRPEVSA